MRKKWARRIAILTGLLVLLLASLFALIQNPAGVPDTTESRRQAPPTEQLETVILDSRRIDAGRRVYNQQTCARCHSIAGKGNPRNPLDGVGSKRTIEELRDWITGADTLQDELPEHIFELKHKYKELSDDDLAALLVYMQSLRLKTK